MLIIASSTRIDERLQLSFDSTSAVPCDNFYMELKSARIDGADEPSTVPYYIVFPHELVSIINGASLIMIKGYNLEQQASDQSRYLLYKAVQNKTNCKSVDVIVNNELHLGFEIEHTLEIDVTPDWKVSWTKDREPLFKSEHHKLVCGKDIPTEYEGTPAECYRLTIPYDSPHRKYPSAIPCCRYEE